MKIRLATFCLLVFIGGLSPYLAAAEEVSVSTLKSPVKLTLTLNSKRIKIGEPVWFRLALTNIGTKTIRVYEKMFCPDDLLFIDGFENNATERMGLYIDAQDMDGKTLKAKFPTPLPDSPMMFDPETGDPLPEYVADDLKNPEQKIAARASKVCPKSDIKPSESRETVAWAFKGPQQHANPLQPPGKFAELIQFRFDKPGKYRISAAYNTIPSRHVEEFFRLHGIHRNPKEPHIRVMTPNIVIEVVP